MSHVRPFLEKASGRRYGFEALKTRATSALLALGELAETLPADVGDLVKATRDGRLRFQLTPLGLDQLTGEIERASMNISSSRVIASLLLGSTVLVLADNLDRTPSALTTVGVVGFVVAVAAGLPRIFLSHRVKTGEAMPAFRAPSAPFFRR